MLAYNHYGDSSATIGNLDMRALVGHLTRNIKIQGISAELACRVVVYGAANLRGVEMINCG